MNCQDCEPLLSAYVDDELGVRARADVGTHLRECQACRGLVQELSAIRLAARSLERHVPPPRVWHRLREHVAIDRRPSPVAWWGWPAFASAAVTIAVGAGLWQVGTLLQPSATRTSTTAAADFAAVDPESTYTQAIARLEAVTASDRDALDPDTAHAIDAGLTAIDQAIVESRAALESEPENAPAQESLFQALQRKVALLQETAAVINDVRQGNQESGMRLLPEMN